MSSLDKYFEAAETGIFSDNSAAELASLEAEKQKCEARVEALTESINSSNRKIASWRTKKTTAGKSCKKTLSAYISAEQGKITATRAEISRVKSKISEIKSRISEVSKYKPASYYINQGVSDSTDYHKDLLSSEKSGYGIWYEQNKDSATVAEIAKTKNDSIASQIGIQQKYVDDLTAAYGKMAEIYGESADESVNLQEILNSEQYTLEKLKNSYEEVGAAVKDVLNDKKEEYELDSLNAKLKNQLWNEINDDAEDYEKRAESIKSCNIQLEEQGKAVRDTAEAYREIVEQYGINAEESKKLENQLLSECVAYEKLKSKIEELYALEDYDRKEREDIVFGLNDYLKNNKEFLLSTGMSEEEIYEVAREATGFNKLVDYSLNKPAVEDVISSYDLIGSIMGEILKESFGGIPDGFLKNGDIGNFEDVFSDFDLFMQSFSGIVEIFDVLSVLKELFSGNGGNTYSSVYNLTASGGTSVADQLYEIKKFDSMKKARGLA